MCHASICLFMLDSSIEIIPTKSRLWEQVCYECRVVSIMTAIEHPNILNPLMYGLPRGGVTAIQHSRCGIKLNKGERDDGGVDEGHFTLDHICKLVCEPIACLWKVILEDIYGFHYMCPSIGCSNTKPCKVILCGVLRKPWKSVDYRWEGHCCLVIGFCVHINQHVGCIV